jgi:hypothetical protein
VPNNIFKIYDGRTSFWQWDRKQKLIVLDEKVEEVHFSNRNMTHSIKRDVHLDKDGLRICNVPSELLQLPRNLVAYAYTDGSTVKSVKFAVIKRPMPSDYIADPNEEIEEKFNEIDLKLEELNKTKADNIIYNAEENYIQLVANNIPIGNKIVINTNVDCITELEINGDGDLIAYYADGTTTNIGSVHGVGGIYVPRFEHDKLIFELKDEPGDEQVVYDLDRTNEWSTPEDANATNYIWETL